MVTPSDLLYRARALEEEARDARQAADEAWEAYYAARAAWLPMGPEAPAS